MDGWCFATVNGRLAEIFWRKRGKSKREIVAHAYLKEARYKTKKERSWIEKETKRYRFAYRNEKYILLAS